MMSGMRLSCLIDDFRLSLRRIWRHPAYALGVLSTLALGIAVCAAMVSVVHGVVLKGLDYPEPERLLVLKSGNLSRGGEPGGLSMAEVDALAVPLPAIESSGYYFWDGATYLGSEHPRMLTAIRTGGEFFRTLGVAPLHGRWIDPSASPDETEVVLGHALWSELFGADPGVIGQPFRMQAITGRIVGVMPPEFGYPARGVGLWLNHDDRPLRAQTAMLLNARFLFGIARVSTGVDGATLARDLEQASQRVVDAHGSSFAEWRLQSSSMLDEMVGAVRPVLLALLLIAAMALLVACANVVNLVVLRGVARQQELAVHQALGAGSARLARLVFLETLLLGLLATALGIGLAWLSLTHFVGVGDSGLPRAREIALDAQALAASVGTGLVASLLAALLPAWRLHRAELGTVLRAGDGRVMGSSGAVGRVLPVAACAISVASLSAALLLGASVRQLERVPLGFEPEPVLALQVFRDAALASGPYSRELIERMQALPGVVSAATISSAPLSGIGAIPVDVAVAGREGTEPLRPFVRTVAGPVQDVLQLNLLRGRWLEAGDHSQAEPVAIVNRSFAERVFPEGDAIGQTITLPFFGTAGDRKPFRIVGVMADARTQRVASAPQPEVWLPDAQYGVSSVAILLRAQSDPGALQTPAQQAFWSRHPEQGIYQTLALASLRDRQLAAPRFFARNAGAFALLALLLAAIGVHSVVAFQMARREREFALRMALGAAPRVLAARVMRHGMALGLPAAALGALLGLGFAGVLRSVLVGSEGGAWLSVSLATLCLLAVVTLACLRSARRALRVQPMAALRSE